MTNALANPSSNEISTQREITKVTWNPKDLLDPVTRAFEECTGLNYMDARTVTYWLLATFGIKDIDIFPVLCVYGPTSTGKTTTLVLISNLAHDPVDEILDGTEMSWAAIRDAMKLEKTAVVDEADGIKEQQLVKRFSRDSSTMSVKVQLPDGTWGTVKKNLFGPTVCHRRTPFKDVAVYSRTITVKTRPKTDIRLNPDSAWLYLQQATLGACASSIDWSGVVRGQHRIDDAFSPLIYAAECVGDNEWLDHAKLQIEDAKQILTSGQETEPSELVLTSLIACVSEPLGTIPERVLLKAVAEQVDSEAHRLSSWQVGSILKDLGFEKRRAGGQMWVMIESIDQLRSVAKSLGIEDDWLQDLP